ncbi:MAG: hypothetical protein ACREIC_21990, partial [Limisphaerales bacterium]
IGGSGTTAISATFNNLGGTVEVDSGQLVLANSGVSSNGIFAVAPGASVDLSGGSQPSWTGRLTGSGGGQIILSSGGLTAAGLTLDCSAGMFQWTGGGINGSLTNANELDFAGGTLTGGLINLGLFRHLGAGVFTLTSAGAGSQFYNFGEYRFEGDGVINLLSCCSPVVFNNSGMIHKTGGTNTVLAIPVNNAGGSIQIDAGTLSLASGNFAQSGGGFGVAIGGRAPSQYGQMSVSGSASLSGPLTVVLTNGFKPNLGDQFTILSAGSINGTFTQLNVPAGFGIIYSNTSVTLSVTNTALVARLRVTPSAPATNVFQFYFQSERGLNYIVERSDDLNFTNWVFYKEVLGDGSVIHVSAPATNSNQRFFRVRAP